MEPGPAPRLTGGRVKRREAGVGAETEQRAKEFRDGSLETAGPQTKGSQKQYGPSWEFVIFSCPGLKLQIKTKTKKI